MISDGMKGRFSLEWNGDGFLLCAVYEVHKAVVLSLTANKIES